MNPSDLQVLHQDNHLLAVVKPAGLATMGLAPGLPTLLTVAKEYVKQRYNKPGNVYLGVVSRLDVPVTGVVLLARTSKAARRLNEQFRDRHVEKTYWAAVEGLVPSESGAWTDWLQHDERHRRMHIASPNAPDAKEARLTYQRQEVHAGDSLLEITLETGRKHQIRLQCSDHGHPILGDRKYGSHRPFPRGIALHARRLVITHPTTNTRIEFIAPLPAAWQGLGFDLPVARP